MRPIRKYNINSNLAPCADSFAACVVFVAASAAAALVDAFCAGAGVAIWRTVGATGAPGETPVFSKGFHFSSDFHLFFVDGSVESLSYIADLSELKIYVCILCK